MSKRAYTREQEQKEETVVGFDTLPTELALLIIQTMAIEQLLRFCMTSNKWHTFVLCVRNFAAILYSDECDELYHAGSFNIWETLWRHVFSGPVQGEDFENWAVFNDMYETHFESIFSKSSWYASEEALEFNQIAMDLNKIMQLNARYTRDLGTNKLLLNRGTSRDYIKIGDKYKIEYGGWYNVNEVDDENNNFILICPQKDAKINIIQATPQMIILIQHTNPTDGCLISKIRSPALAGMFTVDDEGLRTLTDEGDQCIQQLVKRYYTEQHLIQSVLLPTTRRIYELYDTLNPSEDPSRIKDASDRYYKTLYLSSF